jgi:hypothetical protein
MVSFLCYLPAVSLKYIYSFDHVVKRKRVGDGDYIYFPIILIQCQNKIKEYNTKDQSIWYFYSTPKFYFWTVRSCRTIGQAHYLRDRNQ